VWRPDPRVAIDDISGTGATTMAQGNQGQGQGQGPKPGQPAGPRPNPPTGPRPAQPASGSSPGVGEKLGAVGQQLQEGASQAGQRLREGYSQAGEQLGHTARHAEGAIARNPGSSLLIGFGVGFGLGLALVSILAKPEENWLERNVPDDIRRRGERAYKRGEQALSDAPDQLHDVLDSLRGLPDVLSKYLPKSFGFR